MPEYYIPPVLLSSENSYVFAQVSNEYDELVGSYSVRTNHVLQSLQASFPTKIDFIYHLIHISKNEVASLRNSGRKTVKEIMEISEILRSDFHLDDDIFSSSNTDVAIPDNRKKSLPDNIDSLFPLITDRMSSLSVRARNAINKLMEKNMNSVKALYFTITSPDFKVAQMWSVGRGTIPEVERFFSSIKDLIEKQNDEDSVKRTVDGYFRATLNDIAIPHDCQQEIFELEEKLGHFPIFAAIKAYLSGLTSESQSIIEGCIRVHVGQTIADREDIAAAVGLSPERVRQKRNKLLDNLTEYFRSLRSLGFVTQNPYSYQMTHLDESINASEGTDFNLNFVNWVLGSTFEEITLLGDVQKVLCGYYQPDSFLCLVPSNLSPLFDFTSFILEVSDVLQQKRTDEVRINLQNLIDTHIKVQYIDDYYPAIETSCRSILYLHFPVEVDYGHIIFKQNARKNTPIIIEEILRAAGHPLKLEEIYDKFMYLYPERYSTIETFRGHMTRNPSILAIGRTSTYTLAEWDQVELRGGSFKSIVIDYLSSLNPSIATVSDVVGFVQRSRPYTNERSILTTLSLTKGHGIAYYYKDGVRYLALADNTYPKEFFPALNDPKSAMAMSINYPKMIEFIESNGRFPFSLRVPDDEILLNRFWSRQDRLYRKGSLSPNGVYFHNLIITKYGHLKIDKKDFEWKQKHTAVIRAIKDGHHMVSDQDYDLELSKWLKNAIHDYRYYKNSMPIWKQEAMDDLMLNISKTDDV